MVVNGMEMEIKCVSLSADEARRLIQQLQWHVRTQEMKTPDELREHLSEMPQQLATEIQELTWKFDREVGELVEHYVLRCGDWDAAAADDDDYIDAEWGEPNVDFIRSEFDEEIRRLTAEANAIVSDAFAA